MKLHAPKMSLSPNIPVFRGMWKFMTGFPIMSFFYDPDKKHVQIGNNSPTVDPINGIKNYNLSTCKLRSIPVSLHIITHLLFKTNTALL